MKLSTKGKYGLIALADLAVAYNNNPQDSFLVLKTIAQKRNISEAYLERIIAKLKKAGLVITQRGSLGGYSIAKMPSEITVAQVLYVLEGPLDVCGCGRDEHTSSGCSRDENTGSCNRLIHCVSQIVCDRINEKINEAIGTMSIEDVLQTYTENHKEL